MAVCSSTLYSCNLEILWSQSLSYEVFFLVSFHYCLSFLSVVWYNTDQSQPELGSIIWFTLPHHKCILEEARQELKRAPEAWCLLVCSPRLAQSVFLYSQAPPAQGWHYPRWAGHSTSITNQENAPQICLQAICHRHLLNWGSLSHVTLAMWCLQKTGQGPRWKILSQKSRWIATGEQRPRMPIGNKYAHTHLYRDTE